MNFKNENVIMLYPYTFFVMGKLKHKVNGIVQ